LSIFGENSRIFFNVFHIEFGRFNGNSMADFKTHVTTSTVCGLALGSAAYFGSEYPLDQCILATGLCSVSGMLPDLDSDNGVPIRETFAFGAAAIPMMLVDRFQHMGLTVEQMVISGMLIYIGIRFGVSRIFKRFTVHRGMWHSIPAAMVAAIFTFLICSCVDVRLRLLKAFAVFLGFCSHLILDEIYSIDFNGRRVRIKKSLGTAMKFWSGNLTANVATYAQLAALVFIVAYDETMMESLGFEPVKVPATAQDWIDGVMNRAKEYSANQQDSVLHDHSHDSANQFR